MIQKTTELCGIRGLTDRTDGFHLSKKLAIVAKRFLLSRHAIIDKLALMETFDTHAKVGRDGILTIDSLPFADGQTVKVHIEPVEPSDAVRQPFVFGLHQGQVWMSDDFDAPLPDSFWLGEDARETPS